MASILMVAAALLGIGAAEPVFVTSDSNGGWSTEGCYVHNNMWNAAKYNPCTSTLYAWSHNKWHVVTRMNNKTGDGAVKTYPNVHRDFRRVPLNSFESITSRFAETSPDVGIYNFAYADVADVPLPKGCAKGAFVHISYAELASPRDTYGHYGPMVAANRLEKSMEDLKRQGVTHLMAYSEGQCDDVNKALFAGLASGKFKTAQEVLTEYARRHFGTDDEAAAAWAQWLAGWGDPFHRDIDQAKAELAELLDKTPNRDAACVPAWVLKTELFDLDRQIGVGDDWTPERLELVERYLETREKIRRGLWGLGPQRHIFGQKFLGAAWYQSWAKHQAAAAERIGKEQ